MNKKMFFMLLGLSLILVYTSGLQSQTLHISDASCMNGEEITGKSVIKVDMMKENFFYVRVEFPSPYGCNQIKLMTSLVGNPNPVGTKDIDPSATSFCFEVYILNPGDYILTLYDCNDVLLTKGTIKVEHQ